MGHRVRVVITIHKPPFTIRIPVGTNHNQTATQITIGNCN